MKSVQTLANKTAIRAAKAESKLAKAEAERMGVYSGDTAGA
ncbi:MAG: hypothetical protein VB853_13455 [Pirellulales bacterium]